MSKPSASFSLVQLFFVRSSVVSIPGHKPDAAESLNPVNTIDVRRDEKDQSMFVCSMRSTTNADQKSTLPYFIDMEAVCSLKQIDDSLDEDTALRGATITAHSVMYGAIREAVSWITGRQPWGQIQLGLSVLTPAQPAAATTAEEPTKKDT